MVGNDEKWRVGRQKFIYISWKNKQRNKTNETEYKMILMLLNGIFAAFPAFWILRCVRAASIIYNPNSAAVHNNFREIQLKAEASRNFADIFP